MTVRNNVPIRTISIRQSVGSPVAKTFAWEVVCHLFDVNFQHPISTEKYRSGCLEPITLGYLRHFKTHTKLPACLEWKIPTYRCILTCTPSNFDILFWLRLHLLPYSLMSLEKIQSKKEMVSHLILSSFCHSCSEIKICQLSTRFAFKPSSSQVPSGSQ